MCALVAPPDWYAKRDTFYRTRCGYCAGFIKWYPEERYIGAPATSGVLYAGGPMTGGGSMCWNRDGRIWIYADSPYDIVGLWGTGA